MIRLPHGEPLRKGDTAAYDAHTFYNMSHYSGVTLFGTNNLDGRTLTGTPTEADAISALYQWARLASYSASKAEEAAQALLTAKGKKRQASEIDLVRFFTQTFIEQYWNFSRFLKTGDLTNIMYANYIYDPSTYRDLETVRDRTRISLPDEMTREWLVTVLNHLTGGGPQTPDFNWAAQYTGSLYRPIPSLQMPRTLWRLLDEEVPDEERGYSNAVKAELSDIHIPRWQLPLDTAASAPLGKADKPKVPSLEDAILPMPKTIQLVLRLQRPMTCRGDEHWTHEGGRGWLPAEVPSQDEYLPSARYPAEEGHSSGEEWLSDVSLTGLFEEEE